MDVDAVASVVYVPSGNGTTIPIAVELQLDGSLARSGGPVLTSAPESSNELGPVVRLVHRERRWVPSVNSPHSDGRTRPSIFSPTPLGEAPRRDDGVQLGHKRSKPCRACAPARSSDMVGLRDATPRYHGTMFQHSTPSSSPASVRALQRFSAVASLLSTEMNPEPGRCPSMLVIGPGASNSNNTFASVPASAGSNWGTTAFRLRARSAAHVRNG